jgi:hypothetical protein
MFSLSLELRTTFGNSCNVIPYDVKYDGDCISGLTFVWGNFIWSCVSVVCRDVTRQAKGLNRLKHVGAFRNGLAYLRWFCHRDDLTNLIPVSAANFLNSSDINTDPPSVVIVWGIPNLWITCSLTKLMTSLDVTNFIGTASTTWWNNLWWPK